MGARHRQYLDHYQLVAVMVLLTVGTTIRALLHRLTVDERTFVVDVVRRWHPFCPEWGGR